MKQGSLWIPKNMNRLNIIAIIFILFTIGSTSAQASSCTGRIYLYADHHYHAMLNRHIDPSGQGYWTNRLLSRSLTGADFARGIIFSQEFMDRHTSNEAFVRILYKALLDRNPDNGGYYYWLSKLYQGVSRNTVLNGFLYSAEFASVANRSCVRPR